MHTHFFSVRTFNNNTNIAVPILTHYHDSIELIHVLDGSLNCLIQGDIYVFEKGSFAIINQKQPHRIYPDEQNGCTFQSLVIEPSIFTSNQEIYKKYIETILLDKDFSHLVYSSKNKYVKNIVSLMNAIEELEQHKPVGYELSLIAFTYMIFQDLYIIYTNMNDEISSPINAEVMLYRKMADFIYENYENKITLDDIAMSGDMSKSKCCIIFKKYAQNSPIDFLNLYRLEMSTSLLKNTTDSISSIAIDCGFGQQSYYNRLFLREYNMTPREYRQDKSVTPTTS